jgi:hypothetical protein
MANRKTATYFISLEQASQLHQLATALGFTQTKGMGVHCQQGNASALLRSLVAVYQASPDQLVTALSGCGVRGEL